jgi:hypothetical protein
LFKALETTEATVKSLKAVDLGSIKEIDAADKREVMKRLYNAVETITAFTDNQVAKLPIRAGTAA